MRPCYHVEIVTPKKVALNGLWYGPRRAKRVIVWVHGLGSSMFSKLYLADPLVGANTAVLVFNNRGHDKVASGSSAKNKRVRFGAAHEIFTDCVDDIQGAVKFAKRSGATHITLAGHSTGCQKSAYWGAKIGSGVDQIIFLAPMSDYASELKAQGVKTLSRVERVARRYVAEGRAHELLPEGIWSWRWEADAQRFLSLYTGSGPEEIFTYWNPKRIPKTLRSIRKPVLVLLAASDEYADRPASKIRDWFADHLKPGDRIVIVPRVRHSFKGAEKFVAREIRKFIA